MSADSTPDGMSWLRSRFQDSRIDGRVLVLVVVFGGLLTLQSSSNLDAPKIVYLLLAGASLAAAVVSLRWWLIADRAMIARHWIVSSLAFAALLVLSLAVSRAHGTPVGSWLRDSATYVLFAAAPILGLACARSASRRWIVVVIVICGWLAAVSFVIEWLRLRNILDIPIDRIVLPAGSLGSALIALATAFAFVGAWRRWLWAAVAGALIGLFFVTGTRSTLLLLAVPIGAGLIAGRPWRRAISVVAIEVVVAVAVFVVAAAGISAVNRAPAVAVTQPTPSAAAGASASTTPPPNELGTRINGVSSLVADPGSDQSLQERWSQTKSAWRAFLTSPIVGVGPGYGFEWTDSASHARSAYTLDTPLVYLAKFGLVGLFPLILFVAALLRLILALWAARTQAEVELLAVAGYGILLAASSALGAQMEDKGVSFALILLVGFGCTALIRGVRESPPKPRSALVGP
jgi:hypothetical protein